MKRRILISSALAGACGAFAPFACAQAQDFPKKPVKIIVAFPSGGINDLMARAIADRLTARLGQPVIVEAKPGGNSTIGTDFVAKSDPDGHTLLLASMALAVTPAVVKTSWDPLRDFTGVAYLGIAPILVVAHPSLGVSDMKGLVALARKMNGQLNYGNPGNGSSLHLTAELFQHANGVKLTAINYKGSPPSIPDFLAGQVPLGFYPFSVIIGHVRAGKAKVLAVGSPVRHKQLPDVPTMAEQGFGSSQVESWLTLVAPKGTPPAVLDRLNKEVNAVLAEPQTIAAFENLGATALAGSTSQQTTAMLANEVKRWSELVPKMGIKSD